jgi:glutathione S-transferase
MPLEPEVGMQLVIGNQKYSSWSMRPWVAMKHFGIEFETIKLKLFTPEFAEQIRSYSTVGTVPVLVDSEFGSITDSLAILESLAEQHPQMWPQKPLLRAKARSACALMHSGFVAMRSEMPMNCSARQRQLEITESCARDVVAVQTLWQECMDLTSELGVEDNGYLFGDFSIADACFAPVVVRLNGYTVSITDSSKRYLQRMLATPAVAEWIQEGQAETVIVPEDEVGGF